MNYFKRFSGDIMKCFRCGTKLEIEHTEMEADYPLVCLECDENMFIFESIEEYDGEAIDMYKYVPKVKEMVKNGIIELN